MLSRLECLHRCNPCRVTCHFLLASSNESQEAYKLVHSAWPWSSVRCDTLFRPSVLLAYLYYPIPQPPSCSWTDKCPRPLGETYNLYAWSGSELFVIMVCGSIPPIKPLYDFIFDSKSHRHRGYAPHGSYERSYELGGKVKVTEYGSNQSSASESAVAG